MQIEGGGGGRCGIERHAHSSPFGDSLGHAAVLPSQDDGAGCGGEYGALPGAAANLMGR